MPRKTPIHSRNSHKPRQHNTDSPAGLAQRPPIAPKPIFAGTKIQLNQDIIENWKTAIMRFARLKGLRTLPTDSDDLKIAQIARRQQKSLTLLWRTFNTERSELNPKLLNDHENVINYLLGFHMANAARLQGTLSRLQQRSSIWSSLSKTFQRVQVFDLGCGTGALSQVVADQLQKNAGFGVDAIKVHVIDQNRHLLDVAEVVLAEQLGQDGVQSHRFQLHDLIFDSKSIFFRDTDQKTLSIISLGYVWNELHKNPRARAKVAQLIDQFDKQKRPLLLLILEPGQEQQSRGAMELRQQLHEDGMQILYPCPQSDNCPMLKLSRDWCYSEFLWAKPALQQIIDNLLAIKRDVIATSAFVIANSTLASHRQITNAAVQKQIRPAIVGRPLIAENSTQLPQTPAGQFAKLSKEERASIQTSNTFAYLLCNGSKLDKSPAQPSRIDMKLRGELMIEQPATALQKVKATTIDKVAKPSDKKKPSLGTSRDQRQKRP